VEEIGEERRTGRISSDDYAYLLRNHPKGPRLLREFRLVGGRNRRARRLRELEDLGGVGRNTCP
jgi:hypothetical protein